MQRVKFSRLAETETFLLLPMHSPKLQVLKSLHQTSANKSLKASISKLSLTYNAVQTSQLSCRQQFCFQSPWSTRSPSHVSLSRPICSPMKFCNRSLLFATPVLRNKQDFLQPQPVLVNKVLHRGQRPAHGKEWNERF